MKQYVSKYLNVNHIFWILDVGAHVGIYSSGSVRCWRICVSEVRRKVTKEVTAQTQTQKAAEFKLSSNRFTVTLLSLLWCLFIVCVLSLPLSTGVYEHRHYLV